MSHFFQIIVFYIGDVGFEPYFLQIIVFYVSDVGFEFGPTENLTTPSTNRASVSKQFSHWFVEQVLQTGDMNCLHLRVPFGVFFQRLPQTSHRSQPLFSLLPALSPFTLRAPRPLPILSLSAPRRLRTLSPWRGRRRRRSTPSSASRGRTRPWPSASSRYRPQPPSVSPSRC